MAVEKFQAAKAALDSFRADKANQKVLHAYFELVSGYNSALENASDAYLRNADAVGKNYGGFYLKQGNRKIDVEKLVEIYPTAMLYCDTVPKMTLASFDKLVTEGKLPPELADEVIGYQDPTVKGFDPE